MSEISTFLKVDGIEGESGKKGHEKEIVVVSWGWQVDNGSDSRGSGLGVGQAREGALQITHLYDNASPLLAKKCAEGATLKEVKLVAAKAAAGSQNFLTVTLKQAMITRVAPVGRPDGSIIEEVDFKYGEISFEYKPQKDNSMGPAQKMSWNIKTHEIN